MHNKDKHIQKILNYLLNELTDKDRYAFERSMEADPFLRDAVEGYEKLNEEEIKRALNSLYSQLRNSKTKQFPVWLRVAAVGILLLGIGSLLIISKNGKKDGLVADRVELETDNKDLSVNQSSSPINEIKPAVGVSEYKEKSLEKVEENREHQSKVFIDILKPEKVVNISDDVDLAEEMEMDVDSENEEINIMIHNEIRDEEEEDVLKMDELNTQQGVLTEGYSANNEIIVYKGKVVDEDGIPLQGVEVVNQGTLKGTVTDVEGNFEINVPKQKKSCSLAFNSIGFKSKNIMPEDDSLGEIVLNSDHLALDEVVTIGYGTVKKSEKTRSLAKAKLNDKSVSNPSHLIPEPVIGMRKFIKKIEKNLKYPLTGTNKRLEVKVKVFISAYGEVKDIQIITNINDDFAVELKKKIVATSKWIPPYINGMPIESSRVVVFSFE